MITTAPAWRPSLLYRLDCQGGANNKHLINAAIATVYNILKSDIIVNSFDEAIVYNTIERFFSNYTNQISNIVNSHYRGVDCLAVVAVCDGNSFENYKSYFKYCE
jgi:hypothetical protein